MRLRLVAPLVLLCATSMTAADPTSDLLTAPFAPERIYISYDTGKLQYKLGATAVWQLMPDSTTILISGGTGLTYENYKPLSVRVKVEITEQPDSNYDISAFVKALTTFGSAVIPEAPKPSAALLPETAPPSCPFDVLAKAAKTLSESIRQAPLTADDVKKWQNTSGMTGIDATLTEIAKASKAVADKVDDITKQLIAIAIVEAAVTGGIDKGNATCKEFGMVSLGLSAEAKLAAQQRIRDLGSLKDSLDRLVKYLKSFSVSTAWTGNDYTISIPSASAGKQLTVKITATTQTLVLGPTSVAVQDTPNSEATKTVVLRAYRLFPNEVGVAALYTGIRYPQYGTGTVNGQTVVKAADNLGNTVGGAVMLNWICRCGGASAVYPGFQIGIGTAQQAPSLLAGISFRFVSPQPISLMGGGILTWAKQLDTLKLGDPVSGTAQLQSDLKLKTLPVSWYVGIQYSFGK